MFYKWAMNNGYNKNLTIDRIDNNKGYYPENCRFVDKETQQRNRRTTLKYTINGKTHCLTEWCKIFNLNYQTVRARVRKYGWSIEKALDLKRKELK